MWTLLWVMPEAGVPRNVNSPDAPRGHREQEPGWAWVVPVVLMTRGVSWQSSLGGALIWWKVLCWWLWGFSSSAVPAVVTVVLGWMLR